MFSWLFGKAKNKSKRENLTEHTSGLSAQEENPKNSVRISDGVIYFNGSARPQSSVSISDLIGVAVETTDQGPFTEDVWWHIATPDKVLTIPSEALGFSEILHALQKLPSFNNEKLIAAMSSTENRMFILWDKEGRQNTP